MVTIAKFAYLFSSVYFFNVVSCKDRRARPTPATAQSVVQFVDIQDCLSVPDGIYADPTDCHRYYHCNNGKTYYFRCYDGFVFHPCQMKCSFRDSCISAESCSKSLNKTSVSKSTQSTFDIQEPLADDNDGGPLSAEHRKLLKLAYSIPILNELDAKLNLKPPRNNDIHGTRSKSEANSTAEQQLLTTTEQSPHTTTSSDSVGTTKTKPKKRIPSITTDAEPQPDTSGTTEATQTYIVKVVFAKRNQPGVGNEIDPLTTVAVSSSTTDEASTTNDSSTMTFEEFLNTTDKNSTIHVNLTNTDVDGTSDNATFDMSLNATHSTEMRQELNSSRIENGTFANHTNSNSNSTNNDTIETENSSNQTTTMGSFNETTFDIDNVTIANSTIDPEIAATNKSEGLVIESNSIDSVSAGPAKNFIKESTKEFERSTTNTTADYSSVTPSLQETTLEFEAQTNFTSSFKTNDTVATTTTTNETLSSTTVYNVTTEVEETGAIERNSTTTVGVMGRTGEIINNITLSCNPTISSAMCDSMSNQTRESLLKRCSNLSCQNGGMYISLSNGHCGCVCPNGFKGDSCQDLIDRAACRCANGGRCVQVINDTFTCMCPLGMLGSQCQYSMMDIQPKVSNLVKLSGDSASPPSLDESKHKNSFKNYILCSTNVCFNGGLCLQQVDNLSRRKCFCSDNFGGQYCERAFAS